MSKITTNDLLNLDSREEESKIKIQKVLLSIKPLSKFKDLKEVPQYALEKVVHSMCYKYDIYISSIVQDCWSNSKYDIWRAYIQTPKNVEKKIYGVSIYDLFAKIVIYIYSLSKSNKLTER